jgi:hypothetical protein
MIDWNDTERESGATAMLVAMSMLVLMGFAALAVDIGLAMNERRQDQSAADVGSLAAVQFAQPNVGCSGSACLTQAETNGANEAILVANASLDDPTLADWSDAALCGAPPSGEGFSVTSVSPCVAFTNGFDRAWVKIPTIASPNFFRCFPSSSLEARQGPTTTVSRPGRTRTGGCVRIFPRSGTSARWISSFTET